MKKLLLVVFLLLFLAIPTQTFAHLAGQPSFFMINGKYTALYPVQSASLTNLNLPQDGSPDLYLVNIPIDLVMDTSKMMIPQDIIDQTKFQWDFGDGIKGEGLKNTHSYTKQGSYILSIFALSPDLSTPQLIQSVMVNVLPNKNYKLPKSIIKINGQQSKNPATDILQIPFLEQITYDGSSSQNGSGKIISYFWDLGDEKSANTGLVTHMLPNQYYMAFPILRIKDANGFISDSYVQVNNTSHNGKIPASKNSPKSQSYTHDEKFLYTVAGAAAVILIAGTLFFVNSRRK